MRDTRPRAQHRPEPRSPPAPPPQGAPEAERRIGAGGDSKRRREGGPGAGRGGAATDCGDAAAHGAVQSVLAAELCGRVRARAAVGRCGGGRAVR